MNTTSKATGFGYSLYGIASVLVLVGVVLHWSEPDGVGGYLLAIGVGLGIKAALKLGHLKRW